MGIQWMSKAVAIVVEFQHIWLFNGWVRLLLLLLSDNFNLHARWRSGRRSCFRGNALQQNKYQMRLDWVLYHIDYKPNSYAQSGILFKEYTTTTGSYSLGRLRHSFIFLFNLDTIRKKKVSGCSWPEKSTQHRVKSFLLRRWRRPLVFPHISFYRLSRF